jgi:hypothetical protein
MGVALGETETGREPCGHAVRGDDDRGAVGDLVTAAAAVRVDRPGRDADDTARALVEHRAGDVGALEQLGACGTGVLDECVVEAHARACEPVRGVARQLRPGQLEAVSATHDAQTLVADPAVALAERHAHRDELLDRAGRQAVAADLVPRERRLVEEQHVEASRRAVIRRARSCRASTDDDDISVIVPCVDHGLPHL